MKAAAKGDSGAAAAAQLKSLGLQLRQDSSLISYIFIKAHQQSKEDDDQQQSHAAQQQQQQQQQQQHKHAVFVTGLPLGLEEDDLAAVFSCFGDVSQVVLHQTKVR
jgi:hypothetical protein